MNQPAWIFTPAQVKAADRTKLMSYTRADRKAFTVSTHTVACSGCSLESTRNDYKWVPVDPKVMGPTASYLCVSNVVTGWRCTSC